MKRFALLTSIAIALSAQACAQDHSIFHRWEVDSTRSTVGFDATSTLHDFTGTCQQVGGEAHANLNAIAQTAGGIIWCQASSLDTDNEDRDENMFKNLEVAKFPKITFSISSVKGTLTHGKGRLNLSGSYTIRGIRKERSFPIDVEFLEDGGLHVTGGSKFLLSEHQVVPESVMGIIGVDDEVEAWFDLYLLPRSGDLVAVTHYPIQVRETVAAPDQDRETMQLSTHLYFTQQASYFDFEGVRSVSNTLGVERTRLKDSNTTATWESNDQGFLDSRARVQRLQAKYEKMTESKRKKAGAKIEQTIHRLKATLLFAPPTGSQAEIIKQDTRTIVRLGQRDWVVFDNLEGDAKIPGLFSTLPDLPKDVQRVLQTMEGTPSQVMVHSATAAGTRELSFQFGTPSNQEIQAWNFLPKTWLKDNELKD